MTDNYVKFENGEIHIKESLDEVMNTVWKGGTTLEKDYVCATTSSNADDSGSRS